MDQDRMTVPETADLLGITVDAVRKRIHRGTLTSEKAADGRVYVLLDADLDTDTPRSEYDALKDELIEDLRDRVRRLEGELDTRTEEIRRRDHIIAALTERIPELLAPASADQPPQHPQDPGDTSGKGPAPQEQQTGTERPWWRRVFGG
jgi:predicted  nucleic acid-binding Zn-ribbon protein